MIWLFVIVIVFFFCRFFYMGGQWMMQKEIEEKLKDYVIIKKIDIVI